MEYPVRSSVYRAGGRYSVTDAELVGQALAGKVEAYGRLVNRHQAAVARLCRGLCGPGLDADELAHDALVDGFLKLPQLRTPERFGAWIRTVALNRCRQWHRERARLTPLTEEESDALVAPEDDPTDHAALAHAMFALSPAHRLILVLHYWEGLPYADIAAFTALPIGTVMSRLHRARANVRKAMETQDESLTPAFTPDIRREVDAEIRLMLSMVEKEPALRGRLAVLLARSPNRFSDMIRGAGAAGARDVALLLPRLGAEAVDRLLDWSADADDALREGSLATLRAVASTPAQVAERSGTARVASRALYLVVDRILAHVEDPGRRAGLFLDLLSRAGKDDRAALLLTGALVSLSRPALDALVSAMAPLRSARELHSGGDALYAACRFGSRFAAHLEPSLHGEGPLALPVALAAAEGLGRALRMWSDIGRPDEARRRADSRHRRKWAPPAEADRAPAALAGLADALAAHTSGPAGEERQRAIRALGMLPVTTGLEALLAGTRSDCPRTRLTAIRALGDRADPAAGPRLAELAEGASAEERAAAVQALNGLRNRNAAGTPVTPSASAGFRMADVVRDGAQPAGNVSVEVALSGIGEDREYDEPEITRVIASACWDYSTVRRYLIEEGLMQRARGRYTFTEAGRVAWRVERMIAAAP
jgi:RNA polymerase sigma-70 factor (ECF subfamily)